MATKNKTRNPSGNSRYAQNKQIRRDALREELASRTYLGQLQKIADRLDPEAKNAYAREDVAMVKERINVLRHLLDKTLPNLRPVDQPVSFPLKANLTEQAASIVRAVAAGKITPNQATELMSILTSQTRVIEADEFEQRLAKLEQAHGD
jgi:polyhydroxyalkanoate synthesis regulator phasin